MDRLNRMLQAAQGMGGMSSASLGQVRLSHINIYHLVNSLMLLMLEYTA